MKNETTFDPNRENELVNQILASSNEENTKKLIKAFEKAFGKEFKSLYINSSLSFWDGDPIETIGCRRIIFDNSPIFIHLINMKRSSGDYGEFHEEFSNLVMYSKDRIYSYSIMWKSTYYNEEPLYNDKLFFENYCEKISEYELTRLDIKSITKNGISFVMGNNHELMAEEVTKR